MFYLQLGGHLRKTLTKVVSQSKSSTRDGPATLVFAEMRLYKWAASENRSYLDSSYVRVCPVLGGVLRHDVIFRFVSPL